VESYYQMFPRYVLLGDGVQWWGCENGSKLRLGLSDARTNDPFRVGLENFLRSVEVLSEGVVMRNTFMYMLELY
jgi:hypothetical protein